MGRIRERPEEQEEEACPTEAQSVIGGLCFSFENLISFRVLLAYDFQHSDMYIAGAYAALKKIRELGATMVVLKENSPSCGSAMIYDGRFEDRKIHGNGVTAALLEREGIKVISERDFAEMAAFMK